MNLQLKTNYSLSMNTPPSDIYQTLISVIKESIKAVMNIKIGFQSNREKLDFSNQPQTFELDTDSSIIEQFQQIEDYLQNISKRLNRLEMAMNHREIEMTSQRNTSISN
jgi:hypothetical protein